MSLDWHRDGGLAAFLPLEHVLAAMSAGGVILGFYLIHALRRRLRVNYRLCCAAHAVNAALLVLLIVVAWQVDTAIA